MNALNLFFKKLLRYLLKPLSFVPALLMMYIIFSFSGQDGNTSGGLSHLVSKYIVLAYNKIFFLHLSNPELENIIAQIHPYVRKFTHISEYCLLAASVSLPLYVYRLRGLLLTVTAGAFCIFFAALDEYHQTFIAGRVGCLKDVFIDSIGIFIGIIIVRIFGFIGRKTIFSFLSLEKTQKK